MDLKGFTLFTALVGFIIIAFGLLIIQHMDNSEENHSRIILSLKSQSEMQAIKDFLRLESFNAINILLRVTVYQYFSKCVDNLGNDNEDGCSEIERRISSVPLDYRSDMNQLKSQFEKTIFFSSCDPIEGTSCQTNAFSNYLAQNLSSNLQNFRGTFRNVYRFRIYDPVQLKVESPDRQNLIDTTQTLNITTTGIVSASNQVLFSERTSSSKSILNVNNCDITNCIDGSFYIKSNYNNIDDLIYLNLPRVFLFKDKPQLTTLDDAIIPRAYINYYVPFRIFGSMSFAKNLIEKYGGFETQINSKNANLKNYTIPNKIESCPSSFTPSSLSEIYDQIVKSSLEKEVCDMLNNKTQNDFKISKCTINASFVNTHNITLNGILPTPINLVNKKVGVVNIYLTINEENKDYTFGEENLSYTFNFPINTSSQTDTTNINCNCTLNPDATFRCS